MFGILINGKTSLEAERERDARLSGLRDTALEPVIAAQLTSSFGIPSIDLNYLLLIAEYEDSEVQVTW